MTDGTATARSKSENLTREWRRWIAASLLDGMALVDVLTLLEENGISRSESVPYCARLFDDPTFEAGRQLSARLHKIESVLSMREQMQATCPVLPTIESRSGLTGEEFLEEYYSRNQPVLMTDVCHQWPARTRWTPDDLVAKVGSADVEVMAARSSDPMYEINSDQHKFLMPFDEFMAKVETTENGNDLYLVANNKLLASPAAAALWEDFDLDPRFLRLDGDRSQAFLWLGPAGTITPLHHDSLNVMFNQVVGRKRFILVPALSIHRMYNHVAVYSQVDPLSPDAERFPRFAGAPRLTFEIGPGESLFIPAGWWHHVEALERSVSVSFTNFRWDNALTWVHPESLP